MFCQMTWAPDVEMANRTSDFDKDGHRDYQTNALCSLGDTIWNGPQGWCNKGLLSSIIATGR